MQSHWCFVLDVQNLTGKCLVRLILLTHWLCFWRHRLSSPGSTLLRQGFCGAGWNVGADRQAGCDQHPALSSVTSQALRDAPGEMCCWVHLEPDPRHWVLSASEVWRMWGCLAYCTASPFLSGNKRDSIPSTDFAQTGLSEKIILYKFIF